MLKKWMLGMILLTTSSFSQATLITSAVDAVDMVGIEVTAFFADNSQDTQVWSALTSTTGGVENNGWSLKVDGNTFSNYDQSTGTFANGLWTLTNLSINQGIVGITIDAGMKDFYFDVLSGPSPTNPSGTFGTPGSLGGREFFTDGADSVTNSVVYGDLFNAPDLFGTLSFGWAAGDALAINQTLNFVTDTDKATVPEPATMFTFALGLIALTSLRKKSSGK